MVVIVCYKYYIMVVVVYYKYYIMVVIVCYKYYIMVVVVYYKYYIMVVGDGNIGSSGGSYIQIYAAAGIICTLFLALMLLTFTTRRLVRSAHLALSPICFTSQFDFAVSDSKYILHCWVRRDGLISALVTTSSPRLESRAWCGDLCWDELISLSQRCRMHIM